ncbi:MAG: transglutaminase-like cysteine peptidase [Aestuariivirga sp.]|uniref:transglutaminase-like cysteine peptidase n=1 Tax=Aestuariivirga sp. TaxID=2650926 RepID=UPI0030162B65
MAHNLHIMDKPMGTMMKTKIAATLAVLLIGFAGPAGAAKNDTEALRDSPARAAPTYGRTLPPVGFVKFCGRHPVACAARVSGVVRPHLTARQWELVTRVNAYVNAEVKPASDEEIYGEPEHWDYPGQRGDCEDYALLKQRWLEALGLPRAALLLTVALDDKQEGHAMLTLVTSEGDFILDNRRDGVRRWSDSDYTFLKRQSQRDPRDWMALIRDPKGQEGNVAVRSAR